MRKVLWAVLVVGVLLILAPFVMGLPAKASGGQQMMDDFEPIMEQSNVDKTAEYYDEVFVPLGVISPAFNEETVARYQGYIDGMTAMQADAEKMIPALAQALGMTEEQVQGFMGQQFPAMMQMLQGMPAMQADLEQMVGMMAANTNIFAQVPAGLDHYEPLVRTMQGSVGNYNDVTSLPDFTLFTWFFVVPGVILVVLAVVGLAAGRRPTGGDTGTSTGEPVAPSELTPV